MKKLINDEMSLKIIHTAEKIVTEDGIETLNVSKILRELNITNRVFYNRFNNIEDVLNEVYNNIILQIRETITPDYDGKQDFFEYVLDIITNSLMLSYDLKMKFNLYIFGNDSLSESNYQWYISRIKQLIKYARENDLVKDFDDDAMSYTIWCACRGFNADAVMRIGKEEAIKRFRHSFKFLLDGIKK